MQPTKETRETCFAMYLFPWAGQNKTKQKLDTDESAIGTKTKLRLNVRS